MDDLMPAPLPAEAQEIEIVRPIAYFFRDERTKEKYPIYEARTTAWWMDSGVKLNLLLLCFRRGELVREACESTSITYEQYRDFRLLHPWLPQLIRSYRHTIPNRLKGIILRAALGSPEVRDKDGKVITPAVEGNAKVALGAYRIFAVPEDDPDFVNDGTKVAIPISGGSSQTLIRETIRDKDGKILITRKTAELLEKYGNDTE